MSAFGKFGKYKVVGKAEQCSELLRRKRVGVFHGDPFGARKIGRGDDAGALGEFGEGFLGGFEGEKNGGRLKRSNRKHFAADFEDEIVAPLNLLRGVRKREAEFSDGFDGIYGHVPVPVERISLPRNGGKRNRASTADVAQRWRYRLEDGG